ncbi:AAA family ATPase [Hansschlegelia zhihuaiae]|uniref:AAA family ATPase n=1 Tax=Hansschlegelia zhihuaiae TaxID=405005 RepID=UPI0013E899FF|nr:AAA family ATPase [Hansschlegelia zhihuaiae]
MKISARHVRRTERTDDDDDLEYLDAIPEYGAGTPRILLAKAVLAAAIPSEVKKAFKARLPIIVLVDAPTVVWTEAIAAQASVLFPGVRVISATKPPARGTTPDCPPPTSPILAVTPNRSWLSPAAVAAADFSFRLEVRPASVAQAIASFCGRKSCQVTASDYASLDLTDLAFAMRPNSTPEECVERMHRAIRSRASATPTDRTAELSQLAGFGEAAQSMRLIALDFVSQREIGGNIVLPNILLYGPPGTGKTTLARSFARTVNAPLIQTSVAEWFTSSAGHLGDVASAAQRFFEQATALAPSVALIDEIDAIPNRETMDDRDRSWWTPIITGLLVQIDQLRARSRGVVLIAATNHKSKLDSALIRPGRFDLHIQIRGPQTEKEIEGVFRHYLGDDLVDDDLTAAIRLAGKPTGAIIEAWVSRARDEARRDQRILSFSDLVAIIAPADKRSPQEIEEVALHEAAHAVVACALGLEVISASIIDTETSGGVTELGHGSSIFSRRELECRAVAILAGRACDERLSRGPTSGAASDLWKSTALVLDIHSRLGLGDTLVSRESIDAAHLSLDPHLRSMVEQDLRRLMNEARDHVERLEQPIRALAARLVRHRVVLANEIHGCLGGGFGERSSVSPSETAP